MSGLNYIDAGKQAIEWYRRTYNITSPNAKPAKGPNGDGSWHVVVESAEGPTATVQLYPDGRVEFIGNGNLVKD